MSPVTRTEFRRGVGMLSLSTGRCLIDARGLSLVHTAHLAKTTAARLTANGGTGPNEGTPPTLEHAISARSGQPGPGPAAGGS
jgi:hypothetical protein